MANENFVRSHKTRARYRAAHPNMNPNLTGIRREGIIIGRSGEYLGVLLLAGSELIKHPTDLMWRGRYVEVKTARKRHPKLRSYVTGEWMEGSTYAWKFNLERQQGSADDYLLICADADGVVEHVLLVPASFFKVGQLNLPESRLVNYERYRVPLNGLTIKLSELDQV